MTAAYRLKGLGWFGGVVIVSLGFYLISLQVAAERKRLVQIDAKIHSAQRDIRALEIEFDVRSNLAQLERWNGDILALVAPTAGQFVRDEGALASISFDRAQPGSAPGRAGVQTAALVVPALPALTQPALTQPALSQPVVIDEAPAVRPVAATRPAFVQVAAPTPEAIRPSIVKAVAIAPATPQVSIRKAKAVAMLDRTLLSDSTLGDLLSGARAETRRLH